MARSPASEIKAVITRLTLAERAEVARCLHEWEDDACANQVQQSAPRPHPHTEASQRRSRVRLCAWSGAMRFVACGAARPIKTSQLCPAFPKQVGGGAGKAQ